MDGLKDLINSSHIDRPLHIVDQKAEAKLGRGFFYAFTEEKIGAVIALDRSKRMFRHAKTLFLFGDIVFNPDRNGFLNRILSKERIVRCEPFRRLDHRGLFSIHPGGDKFSVGTKIDDFMVLCGRGASVLQARQAGLQAYSALSPLDRIRDNV